MAIHVDTLNRALVRLGVSEMVNADTDPRPEVNVAKVLWDTTRDIVLGAHDWPFARTRVAAAPDPTAPPEGYAYAYTLPPDCVRPRQIWDGAQAHDTDDNPHMRVEGRVILTDVQAAEIVYTRRIENFALWAPEVIDAFAYLLAMDLAAGVKADAQLAIRAANMYPAALAIAKAAAAKTGTRAKAPLPGILRARA